MERTLLPYTKENIQNLLKTYGTKSANLAKFTHCACIFLMPVIAKSPLTMSPLLGLVVALLFIFYKSREYKSVLYIPEIFLAVSILMFMFLKVKTLGANTVGIRSISKFFCSYNDSEEAEMMNKIFLLLGVTSMLAFRFFRYFSYIMEIDEVQAFSRPSISQNDLISKAKSASTQLVFPGQSEYREMVPDPPEPKLLEVPDTNGKQAPEEDPFEDLGEQVQYRPLETASAPQARHTLPADLAEPQEVVRSKRTNSVMPSALGLLVESTATGKEKDFFKSFFCRNIDTILRINKITALGLDKEIIDPLILELKDYINISRVEEKWGNTKIFTAKEKFQQQLKFVGSWIWKVCSFLFYDVLLSFFKSFFTNQFVVILIETIIAMLYVVFSDPSFTIYPILIWIFINVYPEYNGSLSLNTKIWLLMVPTGINCLVSKNRVQQDTVTSMNPDFNFNPQIEYSVLDLSTVGVILMSFVILEMILMTSQRSATGGQTKDYLQAVQDALSKKESKASFTSKLFSWLAKQLIENAVYLIMINIYLIALDINIINLGLIVFFIRLILTGGKMPPKMLYALFWYNQSSILLRYAYSHYKLINGTPTSSPKPSTLALCKMIGLEESENLSNTLKFILNFSLQLFLIILIFKERNEDLFKKFQQEMTKEQIRSAFSIGSFQQTLKNIYEFVRFASFHSLPWIAYIVIYLSMIFTSTTVITLVEVGFLIWVFAKHVRLSIESRFCGLDQMTTSWKFLISLSAFLALGRYIIWFVTMDWMREKYDNVSDFYKFITLRLNFIGLIPLNLSQAYLELLPSFLTMYFGSLVLLRAQDVVTTIKCEKDILAIDMSEAIEAPAVDIEGVGASKNPDGLQSIARTMSKMLPRTLADTKPDRDHDIEVKLNDEEVAQIENRNELIRLRMTVIGEINALKSFDSKKMYTTLKFFMIFNFLVTVYLSIKFRVGLGMFSLLSINLYYFWKSHTKFINEAESRHLDTHILKKLKNFYTTYISKKGLARGEEPPSNNMFKKGSGEIDLEKQLGLFTLSIRYNDIKARGTFYKLFPFCLSVIMLLSYLSKFVKLLVDYKGLVQWVNGAMMVAGTLIHSSNMFADIYGYLIILVLTIAELCLTRNLKISLQAQGYSEVFGRGRAGTRKRSDDRRDEADAQLTEEEENPESTTSEYYNVGGNDWNQRKFLIKIKDSEGDSRDTSRKSNMHEFTESGYGRPSCMKVENLVDCPYDEDFFQNLGQELKRKNTSFMQDSNRSEGNLSGSDPLQSCKTQENFAKENEGPQEPKDDEANQQLGKLLYYFENRDLYLNCKMYYGCIYFMVRLAFFILISVGDAIDCLISILSLLYLCYYWYTYKDSLLNSIRAINKLAVVIICIKYLIGCLDIQRENYSGDTVTSFQTSVVLIFVGSNKNKQYYIFDRLIGQSLRDYWLVYECMIFISLQLLIYFYILILQINTDTVKNHIMKVNFMIKMYIRRNTYMHNGSSFYVNFNEWNLPHTRVTEMFLKMGTIYLPIVAILILLGISQRYATIPILAIAILSLALTYKLIFSWLYHILEKKLIIEKYFSWIKKLIWCYIILGSLSRIFTTAIQEQDPSYKPIGSITLVIVGCLICFQIIIDLWSSPDFKKFYREFLNSNKLSQLTIPLCEAYVFNEGKLCKMIANLKSKESLDRRIKIMEKQLVIWHAKFANKATSDTSDVAGQLDKQQVEVWEKDIAELDKEEENLVLELRNEEKLMSKIGFTDKVINYLHISFLRQLKRFNICPHLYLMHFIKMKNSEICKDIEFKIYDYISGEYDEYLDVASAIIEFYQDKKVVESRVADVKKQAHADKKLRESRKSKPREQIANKTPEQLSAGCNLLLKKILKPKHSQLQDMTDTKNNQKVTKMPYFDAKVNEITIRFYNIFQGADAQLEISHRLTIIQKFTQILTLFPWFILANFQMITFGAILFYCLSNPSAVKLILLSHTIISGLTEEQNVPRRFWSKTFIIISSIMVLKLSLKSVFNLHSEGEANDTYSLFQTTHTVNSIIEFVCGNLKYEGAEVAAFLFTILRILQAQMDGCFEQYINEFENVSEAYMRVDSLH